MSAFALHRNLSASLIPTLILTPSKGAQLSGAAQYRQGADRPRSTFKGQMCDLIAQLRAALLNRQATKSAKGRMGIRTQPPKMRQSKVATERILVSPAVIEWACQRSKKSLGDMTKEFPKIKEWGQGDVLPTLGQLHKFARKTYIPIDYLWRKEPPPPDKVSLPDMRTVKNRDIPEPSLELLETVHLCQWRQEWYRDYFRRMSNSFCEFVNTASTETPTKEVADKMRGLLNLPVVPSKGSWEDRVSQLTERAEAIGVLVMRSSMVRSHHRSLDPKEFRGFALVDDQTPLVFINGKDSKGAQAFTLIHELAHLWLGETALSGSEYPGDSDKEQEQWCNQVAAEFLAPEDSLEERYRPTNDNDFMDEVQNLSKLYKVSTLVMLIRLKSLGKVKDATFRISYRAEEEKISEALKKNKGGNADTTRYRQINEASPSLCRAVISSVGGGEITFKEAYDLLGVSNTKALVKIGEKVGVSL